MGAGHAYNIDKHMLVHPEDMTDYKDHLDFVREWKDKPLEAQLKALEETELFFPEGEDILEQMELVEVEEGGKTYHSLDIEQWVDGHYRDGFEFSDAVRDLKEQIVECATEAAEALDFTEDFGAYMDEEREGDIVVLGDGACHIEGFSEVRFKAGLLSDQYNTGVVVFMQDTQGENYIRDIDDEDLLNIVTADFAPNVDFQSLLNVRGLIDSDVVDPFFMEMAENMDHDELEVLLGDKVDDFQRYVDGIEDEDLAPYVDNDAFRKEYANAIVDRLDAARQEVSDLFEQFADKTMDGLIHRFRDKTFYYATSAWTGAPYEKGKVLFSGPVKSPEPEMSPSP